VGWLCVSPAEERQVKMAMAKWHENVVSWHGGCVYKKKSERRHAKKRLGIEPRLNNVQVEAGWGLCAFLSLTDVALGLREMCLLA